MSAPQASDDNRPQFADAVAAQLRRAPRQLSPGTAARIGILIGPLSTDEQICERGIEDSRARGKRPGPRVTQRVVAYAAPHLSEREGTEPLDAA